MVLMNRAQLVTSVIQATGDYKIKDIPLGTVPSYNGNYIWHDFEVIETIIAPIIEIPFFLIVLNPFRQK